jgi:anti-repressor protein
MSKDLVFSFRENNVSVIYENDQIYFNLVDVCRVLDIKNPSQAASRLDEEERHMFNIGRQGNVNFITESGLYTFILSSRKKQALDFKKWLTKEVIPSIRKNGLYVTNDVLEKTLIDPDYIISILQKIKDQQKQLEENKKHVEFSEAFSHTKDTISILEMARLISKIGYPIGQKELFSYLRENEYLIKKGNLKNMPYQKYMDQMLFEVNEKFFNKDSGNPSLYFQTRITGKGQKYFLNKFKELIDTEI